ncbi:hypothetical protein OKW35_004711 [Paraburkholderia sp. MM5477-R1]
MSRLDPQETLEIERRLNGSIELLHRPVESAICKRTL